MGLSGRANAAYAARGPSGLNGGLAQQSEAMAIGGATNNALAWPTDPSSQSVVPNASSMAAPNQRPTLTTLFRTEATSNCYAIGTTCRRFAPNTTNKRQDEANR